MKTAILLYNIRSEHNVGSIFRTADAAGVDKIYLAGYTPAPIDRFGRPVQKIAKVALGAEKAIPWEQKVTLELTLELIQELKEKGTQIVSIEQAEISVGYKEFSQTKDVVYILGDEVRGVPQEILDASDVVVEIPMKGKKESLNVSVTAGIILFNT